MGIDPQRAAMGALIATLTGCPVLEFAAGKDDFDPLPIETTTLDPEEIDGRLRRMRTCREDVRETLTTSKARYEAQVMEDGTPRRRREALRLRGVQQSAFRRCDAMSDTDIPPSLSELETSMGEMLRAARSYASRTRDLASRRNLDPLSETLAELHPGLVAAHAEWRKADAALELDLNNLADSNDPMYLALLRERGDPLELSTRDLMVRGRALARCIAEAPEPGETRGDPGCESAYNTFDESWNRFSLHYDSNRRAADQVFWMSTFSTDVAEYHDAVQRFIKDSPARSKRSKRARSREQGDLKDRYAAIVRDANTLDFNFP